MMNHLAADDLLGAQVHASDDRTIGAIGQVYVEDSTATPVWVTVKTGIFGSSETFIPVIAATFNRGILQVPYSREFVKHAPRIDPDTPLSTAHEDALYRYYDPDTPCGQEPNRTTEHPSGFHDNHRSSEAFPTVTSLTGTAPLAGAGAGAGGFGRALLRRHIVTGTENTVIDAPFDPTASHRRSPLTGT